MNFFPFLFLYGFFYLTLQNILLDEAELKQKMLKMVKCGEFIHKKKLSQFLKSLN